MVLKEIIDRALAEECSDIHLTVGTNMAVRKFGTLEILSEGVSPAECEQMIYSVLDPKQVEYVKSGNDLDVGYMYEDGIRIEQTFTIRETTLQPVYVFCSTIFLLLMSWDSLPW